MYIHRIIIDANCINAKGRLNAMNKLESYHDAGLVEIFKTTTLNAEFRTAPLQKDKSNKYKTIGATYYAQLGKDGVPDAMPGAASGDSKFYHYYKEIFGENQTETHRRQSLRDCMHIDQAILNNADYFVTIEKALIKGGRNVEAIKSKIQILNPEDCLRKIQEYFFKRYGSFSIDELIAKKNLDGPILLGSNSCFGFSIKDPSTNDVLLSSYIKEENIIIEAQVRDEFGSLILEIISGKKIVFYFNGASVNLMGHGPLVVGERCCNQMCIGKNSDVYLAATTTSSGRVIFDRVNLTSRDGDRKIIVKGETMELRGLAFCAPQNGP